MTTKVLGIPRGCNPENSTVPPFSWVRWLDKKQDSVFFGYLWRTPPSEPLSEGGRSTKVLKKHWTKAGRGETMLPPL